MKRPAFRKLHAGLLTAMLLASPLAPAQLQHRISIESPAPMQTVHDNRGNVDVRVSASPELAPGHQIALMLDGERVAQGARMEFALAGVDRGEHRLQALLLARGGEPIASSAPVTFYLWQASRLFPGRQSAR